MRNTILPGRLQISQTLPQLSRRKLYAAMLVASQCVVAGQLWAAPEGGVVVGGEGVITQAGVNTMIHQATERMAIDWRSFDVAANERVEFVQPSSSSIALNRVLSNRGSEILGRIDANGQVMLVNPNGVVFGKNSIVNVGGMIASGLSIDPTSFINGDFALDSIDGAEGKVINYGIINAATGGSVTLVGEQVQNDGVISAKLGTVNLAAGKAAVLTFDSSGMVGVRVTEAVVQSELGVDAAVINNGSINAEGGRVLLSASVSEDIFSNAVNNGGMNKESSVVMHEDGSFTLGAGADVINTGDISVSTTEGNAGQVVALGENITHSGSISANNSKGTGGSVELHSTDTTLLTKNSTVSAQSNVQGKGGDVKVLGNKVGLFDQAEVNASGANGGGQVLVGGDKTGQNKKVRNADFIYLSEDSAVKTDALINGDGGRLITFANDTARIYGDLYSRGGNEGGNGGFIETSGLKGFEILNTPDIMAVAGSGGTWLIDPNNIEIKNVNGDFVENDGPTFTSSEGKTELSITVLEGALKNGATVIVQTGGATTNVADTTGNITLMSDLNYSFNGGTVASATLQLKAHNNIFINENITSTGNDRLNIELIANSDNFGGGSITIASGKTVATNGGYFYAGKSNTNLTNADKLINFTSKDATISTYGELGGGDIVINATNDVSLGALRFDYAPGSATSYDNPATANLVRVGSVTVASGGNVTLNNEIRFNNTGSRQGGGGSGKASSFSGNSDTFLNVDADGDITINGTIHDFEYGDARDSLNIKLIADKNNDNIGTVTIGADIYTAGGNFEASGASFDSRGFIINTDRANSDTRNGAGGTMHGDAQWSNGGDVTINARNNIRLGRVVTDGSCIPLASCTGNLKLEGIDTSNDTGDQFNVQIEQASANITRNGVSISQQLVVAGTTTFNTGTGGNITLNNAGNIFTGNLLFTSAGNVELTDSTAVGLGASNIAGYLELTSGGDVTQSGLLTVDGETTLTLNAASEANRNVDLSNAGNNFSELVAITNANNVSLRGLSNLLVGALATTGDITLQAGPDEANSIILNGDLNSANGTTKNITLNGNVQLAGNRTLNAGTGNIAINGTINSDDADRKNLELNGRDVTLTGAVGNLQALGDVALNSSGLVTVSAPAIDATSFSVTGADTANDSFVLTNGRSNWQITGANSGTVQKLNESNASVSPLISFSGVESITGGASFDTFNIDVVDLDVVVNGGGGNDVFNINVATTNAKLNGDAGNDTFNVETNGDVTATLDGGDDSDTINAADTENIWLLGDGDAEKLNNLTFSNIENVNGNDKVDTFTFSGVRSITGIVDAKGGDDIVKVGSIGFEIDFTGGDSPFSGVANAEVLEATGGRLTVKSNESQVIDWLFGGADGNSVNLIKFIGFTSFAGGDGDDTFSTANATPFTGLIDGGGGDNVFDVSLLSKLTENSIVFSDSYQTDSLATLANIQKIKGNDLTTLKLTSGTNEWEITDSHAGKVGAIEFTGVSKIIGASQSDSIKTSINSNATWSITGTNDGKLLVNDPLEEVIAFSSIGNLIGSSLNDTFSFLTGSSVVSAEGNDGTDTADLSQLAARTITVGASTGFAFSGVEQLKADFSKEFVLITETGETWDIDGVDSGTVAGTKFIGFKNLQGSTADDTFNITAAFTGVINAGAGNDSFIFSGTGSVLNASGGSGAGTDTVDLRNLDVDQNITLDSNKINGVSDIERVIASVANNNTLTAIGANTWDIYDVDDDAATTHDGKVAGMEFIGFKTLAGGTGVNAGEDIFNIKNDFDGTISGGDGADTFNIEGAVTNLQSGAGSDSFVFYGTGSVVSANGGSGADIDIVDLRNLSGAQDIILNGNPIKGVSDIERVVAKVDNNNKLTANGINTWDIKELDGNTATTHDVKVAGVEFIGFKTLSGGTGVNAGVDTFNINNNFDGTISGGDGVDTFNISADVTTISGGAGADIFNIKARVTNLQGGAGNDSFVFYDTGDIGTANAGADADIIDLRNLNGVVNITLSGGLINKVSNGERVVANADKNNTLTANGNNTWDIYDVDENAVTKYDGKVAGIEFIGFKNLAGGTGANAGVDTFNINNSFDGTISGVDGADTFNIKENVTTINGGDGADTFNIEAQVGNISGGNGADTFTFYENGSISTDGIADAGTDGATDSVDLSKLLSGVTVNISGSTVYGIANVERVRADNNKSFVLAASNIPSIWTIDVANGIDGKLNQLEFVGFNTLQGGADVDSFDIKTNFAGAINGNGGADNFVISTSFSGSLDGGADADTFTISAAVTGDLLGGAGNDKFIFNNNGSVNPAQGNTVDAGIGNDEVDLRGVNADRVIALNGSAIYGLNGVERVIGNINRNFTLDASDMTATLSWLIDDIDGAGSEDGVNDGRVQNIEFINFRTLRGSKGNDKFTFNKDFTGTVSSSGGNDEFIFNSGFSGAVISLGGDDLFAINNTITGSLQGGNGADRFVFSGGGNIAANGSADAGDGADIVDLSKIEGDLEVELTGDNTLYGVSHVERILGNKDYNFTLSTNIFGATWEIYDFDGDGILSDGVNDGKVANIEFIDFKNLQGSDGADIFNLRADFAGVISGAGGDDIFNVRTAVTGTLLGENGSDTYIFFNGGSIASTGNSKAGTDGNIDRANFSNLDDGSIVSVSDGLIENIAEIERLVGSATKQFTLSAASGPNTWKITNTDDGNTLDDGVNDGLINGIQFINFKKLLGGSGADEFTFEGANASVESIDGGLGVNVLQGRNALNTWQIIDDYAGTLSANGNVYTIFSRIQNLTGGTLADTFNINAIITNVSGGNGDDRFIFDSLNNAGKASSINGGDGENELVGRDTNNTWTTSADNAGTISVTDDQEVYVTGFSGIQRLIGGDGADVFNLNHRISDGVQAGNGANRFNVNTTVGHLIGGTDDDQFIFGAQGDAQSVNGGGGNANSLTGRNAQNTWTITSTNAGKISSNSNEYLDSFSNIQILNGGTGDDTFNIKASAGSIFGHDGNDIFSFAANNNGVAALINGGVDNDTLRGRIQDSIWKMTGANAGSVSTGGTTYVTEFSEIETLSGQAGADTLAALNQANNWSVTGENHGSLRATTTGAATISFEGMENLLGNEGVDNFVFDSNAANITGLINGGSSITKNVVKDSLNLTQLTRNLTVNLGAFQNNVLNVSNIETITASASNVGNHIIQGASDTEYHWNIDDENKGVIDRNINPLLETSVSFVNFGDLRGGSNRDVFYVEGEISSRIDGGEGDDFVDYSKSQKHVVITLGDGGLEGITRITNIEGVKGNSSAGNALLSTIQVASGTNTWEINGENDGNITINNKKIIFEDFTNLIGGVDNDTFRFIENGQWFGTIDGGGGNDVINSSLSGIDQKFVINGVSPIKETSLKNIDVITGNANTSSTLASRLRENTWRIYSNNDGNLNGDVMFTNIANLEGGGFVDNFTISNLSSLSVINGGGGDDIADLGSINESIWVAIDSQTSADINLINIETINANNNVSNTLLGDAAGNEWTINALNTGVLNKNIIFAGFANITGSAAADTVAFINSAANLTGHIDLAEGSDSFDLTAANRGIIVQLNSSKSALPSGVLSVDNIESISGAAGQKNHLIADNFANTWTLDNINSGQISSAEKSSVLFYEFANLSGGSNDDTFNFESSGNVTGLLNGGGHNVRDLVDLSKSSIADVVIATSSDMAGFTNVEKYIGNNIDSSITAANIDNNWSLSGTNRGFLNDVVEFENFGILKGGNKKDNFTFNQARISGSIDSGDGDDSFKIQESTITGKIQAGKGNDAFEFIVTPGLAGVADIDGGEGTNRLIVNGGDATYKVAHQIGSLEYIDGNNNTYSILYSSLNNIFDDVVANSLSIFGTATVNTFRLQTGRYSIDNSSQINYTNKANLAINGLAGDKAVIDGVVAVAGNITLNNVNISTENGGILQAQSLELVSTGDVGSLNNRLKTAISDLSLSGTDGDIYLEEQDALNLKGFNVSNTDLVDLKIGGNLSSTNPLVYTGALNVASSRGSIQLGNNNLLSGLLNFEAAQDISLGNTQALLIGNLSGQNVNLSSGTSITGVGAFSALGLTTLNAVTDIALVNLGNDFNQLAITNAGAVSIYDKNGLTTLGVSAVNNADLRSAGNIIVGAACSIECANNYGIKAGSLKIQSDATVSINKNIVAAESTDIQAQGISVNDSITSKKINLNSGNGRLLLNEAGTLLAQGGGSIELAAGSIEQHSAVVSDGSIKATAVGDIVMASRATLESQGGDVDLSSNNMKIALVKATEGSVIMNAKGIIADNNLDETNIIASVWRADATNGVGMEGVDAIETDVDRLSVRNLGSIAGTKSSINIANMNSVVIEQLINNGNILFSNANGDVILDNTNNLEFDITKTNAIEQGGVINANTGVNGGGLTLSINGGSIRAINKANKANPDVVAESAAFVYPVPNAYTFGERNRKIVMHIPTYYFQSARTSSVLWHIKKPLTIVDSSVPLKNLLTNDQLIQLEGLNEIDPAIFTNVRNYVHDEVAILMPADQRFDEDEFSE